ncbi:hypothetical protein A8144_06130 [Mycobacterium leprae 3125609]|uniref:Uncharacterized protein MLCB4.12c n=1 Tax=Mycobacterium leprae TaxID=1769 RepID=O69588_MYCLR|nr:hypothetical protein A8144_06130 [Mycobacterium leprae 3125609]OAX71578.1 hypothetical protein A3216_04580 [Mycobacterium leprae 7935681]CAA18933.1 hypothetical protein MLCB4.12c [Mycobacterium leprae]
MPGTGSSPNSIVTTSEHPSYRSSKSTNTPCSNRWCPDDKGPKTDIKDTAYAKPEDADNAVDGTKVIGNVHVTGMNNDRSGILGELDPNVLADTAVRAVGGEYVPDGECIASVRSDNHQRDAAVPDQLGEFATPADGDAETASASFQ